MAYCLLLIEGHSNANVSPAGWPRAHGCPLGRSPPTQTPRLSPAGAPMRLGTTMLSLFGDIAALDQRAEELIAVATEQGFPQWRALGTICRGWVKVQNGDATAHSDDVGRAFRLMSATCSDRSRPGIPIDVGHLFRSQSAGRSD